MQQHYSSPPILSTTTAAAFILPSIPGDSDDVGVASRGLLASCGSRSPSCSAGEAPVVGDDPAILRHKHPHNHAKQGSREQPQSMGDENPLALKSFSTATNVSAETIWAAGFMVFAHTNTSLRPGASDNERDNVGHVVGEENPTRP